MPDLFFSYRTKEAGLAQPLLDALAAEGIDVWRDAARTDAGNSITPAVRRGLSSSRTLLAFYTEAYNDRRARQWELATAWSGAKASRVKVEGGDIDATGMNAKTVEGVRMESKGKDARVTPPGADIQTGGDIDIRVDRRNP